MGNGQVSNLVLRKHIATIHCANTLSLLQRKISNALLYDAYDRLLTQEVHQIAIKDLCDLIGYKGHNYLAIKDALRKLVSTQIEWNLIDDTGEVEWTASSLLASVQLQGAICFYAYSPHMKQLLHSPQIYGIINLAIQSKFKSAYGLALYENVARYKNLTFTKWFDIDLFKQLMGVPKEQYNQFRDFKRRVITQSIKEVNEHSNLNIESEVKRSGREVKAIRFKIINNDSDEQNITAESESSKTVLKFNQQLYLKLNSEYKIAHSKIEKLNETYSELKIREKIELIEKSDAFKKGQIKNMAAYLLDALKENYQESISNHDLQNKLEMNKCKEAESESLKQKKLAAVRAEYDKYVNTRVNDYLAGLTVDEFNSLQVDFENQLIESKNKFCLDLFKKSQLKNILVRSVFYQYVRSCFTSEFSDLISFDEFSTNK